MESEPSTISGLLHVRFPSVQERKSILSLTCRNVKTNGLSLVTQDNGRMSTRQEAHPQSLCWPMSAKDLVKGNQGHGGLSLHPMVRIL